MSALPVEIVLDRDDTVLALELEPRVDRRPTTYQLYVKPVVDFLVASVVLVVTLPITLVIALAIRLTMGPGVIYRQLRVGQGGRIFTIYKFRTMHWDRRMIDLRPYIGRERRICHKREDDPRHTRLGRFLRRTSLDELPQLLNVLRGEMSIVGPRPELVTIVSRYEPWQHDRHQVRPGITGLWQVTRRGKGLMCDNSSVDIDYVHRLSFVTDLSILARTPLAALKRTGT